MVESGGGSLLTPKQREYLQGEVDISDTNRYAKRSRIRDRVRNAGDRWRELEQEWKEDWELLSESDEIDDEFLAEIAFPDLSSVSRQKGESGSKEEFAKLALRDEMEEGSEFIDVMNNLKKDLVKLNNSRASKRDKQRFILKSFIDTWRAAGVPESELYQFIEEFWPSNDRASELFQELFDER